MNVAPFLWMIKTFFKDKKDEIIELEVYLTKKCLE